MRVVVALGGNARLKRGEPMTAESQRSNVRAAAYTEVDPYPLDVLGAQTEAMFGYVLEQELGNAMPPDAPLATILTMVQVDPCDPAFVGPIYAKDEADAMAAQKGWVFKPDGDSWRRACRFGEATGRRAVIGSLTEIGRIVAGEAGTQVVAD